MERPTNGYYDKILKLPYRGHPSTVGLMRDAALSAQNDYIVRQTAEEIVGNVKEKDYISEPLAVGYWVYSNTRYTRDPRTVELVQSPVVLLRQIHDNVKPKCDCDEQSALIAALCLAIGCSVRFTTVAFKNIFVGEQRQYSHVFCQAKDQKSGMWITLDPVAGKDTREMMSRVVAAKTWMVA